MKILLPTIGAVLSLITTCGAAHACAVPRPFFYSLGAADAIARAVVTDYKAIKPGHALMTFEVLESLKGNIPAGRLTVTWAHRLKGEPHILPDEAIVTFRKLSGPDGGGYEVMSGCVIQGIYWTAGDKIMAMKVLNKNK